MGTMAASNQAHYFYGRFRGKARYQRGHSGLYRGFKLATNTFVLSALDVYLHSHIPQALRFYYTFGKCVKLVWSGASY